MLPQPPPSDYDLSRYDQVCEEVAGVMGSINVSFGRLVELTKIAIEEGHAGGVGIGSPTHWLSWRTGLSHHQCENIVKLATRAEELPCAVGALTAGELTVDQAAEIARHVPASFEKSCTEFAKVATVKQLRKALPNYGFTKPDGKPEPKKDESSVATGTDHRSWWLNSRLPEDQGAVVDKALEAMKEDLYRQRAAELGPGVKVPPVTWGEAMVAMAETCLAAGEARFPGSDRYLVHAHLELGPTGPQLTSHMGVALPDHIRRMVLCDCSMRALVHQGVSLLGSGRKTRQVSRRLRRAIEHRDGGCRVPGCGRTTGLHIHHIVHWEDGGATEPDNLIALCNTHHRRHHEGLIGVEGNPELRHGEPGATVFTDPAGRVLDSCGKPIPKVVGAASRPATTTPSEGAAEAARAIGLEPHRYQCPTGERLYLRDVFFNEQKPPPPAASDPPVERGPAPGDRSDDAGSGRHPTGPPTDNGPPKRGQSAA